MLFYFEGNLERSVEFYIQKMYKAVAIAHEILKECKKLLLLYFIILFCFICLRQGLK